jgi:uncharacterized caspase-like protein
MRHSPLHNQEHYKMSFNRSVDGFFATGLDANERRAAALRAEQERAELRSSKIEAQASPFTTPQERIRLWEDLHGLRLPVNADHRLVRVIATSTALTVREVQDEQVRRAGGTTTAVSST